MVNVSKKYLNKDLQTKAWNRFLKEVRKSESAEACVLNLKKFFTRSEITMLEKRLSIQILTEQGLSYKDIGAIIDVSSTTINFVKHNFTKRPVVHKRISPYPKRRRSLLPGYKGGSSFL